MKKYLFMASAAMLFLASCSSDSEEAVVNNNPQEEELAAAKIELGAKGLTSTAQTRAIINTGDDVTAGIFALYDGDDAEWLRKQPAQPTASYVQSVNDEDGLIFNQEAVFAADPDAEAQVVFANSTTYYYPRCSFADAKCYSFYGYAPYEDIANVTAADAAGADAPAQVSVKGAFDGTQDIMFGWSGVPAVITSATLGTKEYTNINGWNNYYVRAVDANGATTKPIIAFNHLTSQLAVSLKAGDGYAANPINVTKVEIATPDDYTLVFKAGGANELSFGTTTTDIDLMKSKFPVFDPTANYVLGDLVSYDGEIYEFASAHDATAWIGTDASSYMFTTTATELDPILFAPQLPADAQNPASVTLKLTFANGTTSTAKVIAPANGLNVTVANAFEAGKKYSVVLEVTTPRVIEAWATVSDWTPVDAGSVEI